MIGWSSRICRAGIARRGVALVALISFAAGNIGWPHSPETSRDQAGPRGCCGKLVALAGPGGCCCGSNAKKSTCGCCKGPAVAKSGACCQKKRADEGNSRLPVLTCHCGDSPVADYVISSQPRLQGIAIAMPQLLAAFERSLPSSQGGPQRALAPETPPPRSSAA